MSECGHLSADEGAGNVACFERVLVAREAWTRIRQGAPLMTMVQLDRAAAVDWEPAVRVGCAWTVATVTTSAVVQASASVTGAFVRVAIVRVMMCPFGFSRRLLAASVRSVDDFLCFGSICSLTRRFVG